MKPIIIFFTFIVIVVPVALIILHHRNNRVYKFRELLNTLCHNWGVNHAGERDFVSAYEWLYKDLPSYRRMLWSFKRLRIENWVSREKIDKLMDVNTSQEPFMMIDEVNEDTVNELEARVLRAQAKGASPKELENSLKLIKLLRGKLNQSPK